MSEGIAPYTVFLTSGRFIPGVRAPDIQWIYSWVGPRASLGAVGKRQISAYEQGSNINSLVVMWDIFKCTTYRHIPKYKEINLILFRGMSAL
jgi:hypothetical protein